LATYGAIQEPKVQSVMALDARGGHVAFSVGHEVLVADEDGRLLFTLEKAPGQPWAFAEVSSVSLDDEGRITVADANRRSLVRFEADGRLGAPVPLDDLPRLSFESATSGARLVVADTMAHQLRLVDSSGRTLKSRRIRYPNGITALQSSEGFRWIVAETGMVRARAFDAELEPVDYGPVKTLNTILARESGASALLGAPVPRWKELLDVAATPSAFAAATCRDDSDTCSVVRVDPRTNKADIVADIGFISAAGAEDSDGILQLSEIALTSSGRVLVASPRLSTILSFEGPGGPPTGGFCRECTPEELGQAPATLDQLEAGVSWRNGTRVSVFGDPAVRQRFQQKRAARNFYVRLQRWGQRGTVAIAILLLIAFGLIRQMGVDQRGSNVGYKQLIRGDGRALTSALAIILAAAGVGSLLGYEFVGWGGAVGGAAAFGGLASRYLVVPLLVRRRRQDAAAVAYEMFLGANAKHPLPTNPGESLYWVRFASAEVQLRQLIGDFRESFQIEDPLEALERLAPRLVLAAATNKRLIITNTSLLGTPIGTVVSREWDPQSGPPPVPPSSLTLFQKGEGERRFNLGGKGGSGEARVRTLAPVYLCQRCRRALGTCEHRPVGRWITGVLALLLPGLAQLVQGRFRGARVAGMAGMGLLSQAFHEFGPQHWGIIPANPSAYQKPMVAYAVLVMTALVEAVIVANREHGRCESNRRELARAPRRAA